jgi:hypothetical protein
MNTARHVALVSAVAGIGCGRVAFDSMSTDAMSTTDAATPHDEDRDGIDDRDDVCPHVPDPLQADVDGDRVGDLCDPNASIASEHIVVFEPFVTQTSQWTFTGSGTPTWDGESLSVDTLDSEYWGYLTIQPGRDTIVVGGHVGQREPTVRNQVMLAVQQDDLAFYYCELYENTPTVKFGLAYTPDYSQFFTLDAATPVSSIADGDFTLTLTTSVASAPAECLTTWPADRQTLTGTPPAITPVRFALYVMGLSIRYDYVIVIRTE